MPKGATTILRLKTSTSVTGELQLYPPLTFSRSSSQSENYNVITGEVKDQPQEVKFYPVEQEEVTFDPNPQSYQNQMKKPELVRPPVQKEESFLDCKCGCGFTCMWLNHFDREEKAKDKRENKLEYNQRQIMANPDKFGSDFNNLNSMKKDSLIKSFVQNGYGNSLLTDQGGCPIKKVHKMKERRREKLKKYLYQGKQNDCHEYDKYKLQSGKAVSIELTPDYNFRMVLDPQRKVHNEEILNQIKRNSTARNQQNKIQREEDQRTQSCYEMKMAKLDRKHEKSKDSHKKQFMNDIDFQIKQKNFYNRKVL